MAGVKGRSGGGNRKSGQLHVVQGTFRPDRHTSAAPDPPAGAPDPPYELEGEAHAEWDRMVARLTASRTLSTVDGALLANFAELWASTCRLQRDANALKRTWYSRVTLDAKGTKHREPRVHPVFAQLKSYRLALRVLLCEFGLTPLSRNRVKASTAANPGTVDPKKARFLNGLAKT